MAQSSFYLGPGRPMLQASTWEDLRAAAQVGSFTETHWFEAKEDVPAAAPGANLELAKDLASLSVDSGTLAIGIRDRPTTEPISS